MSHTRKYEAPDVRDMLLTHIGRRESFDEMQLIEGFAFATGANPYIPHARRAETMRRATIVLRARLDELIDEGIIVRRNGRISRY